MKTYSITNDDGELIGFEVDTWRTGPQLMAKFVETTLGAEISKRRGRFSRDEVQFEFRYLSHKFVVWKQQGDSSRYWIGPDADVPSNSEITGYVQSRFDEYRPGILGLLTGLLGL